MPPPTHAPSHADLANMVQHLAQEVARLSASNLELRQRVMGMDVDRLLRARGLSPRNPVEFKSQNGEDLFLWHLFDGQPSGFFIEIGAYDGYDDSVSYAFEAAGWTGLLIEATPHRAAQCRERRKASRVEHCALGAPGGPATTRFTVVSDPLWDKSSYALDRPEHRKALDSTGHARTTVEVPLRTMNDLLGDHAGPIDFASIDVEGAEFELMQGFDLARYKPRVLLLEDNTLGQDKRLSTLMAKHPYRFLGFLAMNQVYIAESEAGLLTRATTFRL